MCEDMRRRGPNPRRQLFLARDGKTDFKGPGKNFKPQTAPNTRKCRAGRKPRICADEHRFLSELLLPQPLFPICADRRLSVASALRFLRFFVLFKAKSPRPALRPNGGKLGNWEFATLSFPMLALGAPKRGCQLPDAILRGMRSLRPDSAAVQRLAVVEV